MSIGAQTTVTGVFKLPSGQTCAAAAIRTETVGGTAVCGKVRFVPYDAASRRVSLLTFGAVTYVNYEVVGYVRASDNVLLAHDPVAGTVSVAMPLIPNSNATPAGTVMRACFDFHESTNAAIAAPPIVCQQKVIPDQASVDWGTLAPASLTITSVSYQLVTNGSVSGFEDWGTAAAPANPAANTLRVFANSASGKFECKDSAGANCMAAGSGYQTVQDEAVALAARTIVNFTGAGVSCADNAGATRTDCTIAGGGGATPTGAGFRHVTAGVEDAAAKLVENADVDAAAAIAQSKIANLVGDLAAKLPLAGGTMTGTFTARAGAAGAGTAPWKFQSSALMTTPEAFALETDNTSLFFTNSLAARKQLAFTDSNITGNAAGASALAANGANCGAGLLPRGVDAAGAAEGCAAVNLASEVTGTLPIANGGTGNTTASAAFNALDPLTTLGDLLYHDGTNSARLAGNITTARQFLSQTGTGAVSAAPAWGAIVAGDLPAGFVDAASDLAATLCADTQILKKVAGAWACAADDTGAGGGYATVQEEGVSLTQRNTLNFIGAAITAADNVGSTRTDVTLAQSPVGSTSVVGTGRTLTGGAGIAAIGDFSVDRSIATASGEADFFARGALVCGVGTAGSAKVHTTPFQYCDDAATPALQYAAYGNSAGESTAAAASSVALASDVSGTLPVANGGTNLTAAADDNVVVGNGTTWETKAVPDCDAVGKTLRYDTTTNAFSCASTEQLFVVFNSVSSAFSPADLAVMYMVFPLADFSNNTSNRSWIAPFPLTITRIVISTSCGTAGSAESITFTLNVNNADTSLTGTGTWDAAEISTNITGSVAIAAGDRIAIKHTHPTYVTNPLNCRPVGQLAGTIP